MRGLVKAVLAMAAGLAVCSCAQRQQPLSLTHPSVLAKAGLVSYWEMPLRLLKGEKLDRLILLEENLYCLTNRNTMIAVDAATGRAKWTRQVAEPGQRVYRPCHGAGVGLSPNVPGVRGIQIPPTPGSLKYRDIVLVNTIDRVLVLDRADGQELRRITFDSAPYQFTANTGGACDGRHYYVGSADGRCFAIKIDEGVISWILYTGRGVTAPPQCFSPGGLDRVYVAGGDREMYVVKAEDELSRLWPPEGLRSWPALAGPVMAAFHVDARACFVPCFNDRVYAFPLSGGEPLWKLTCKGPLEDDIQVSENTVFQYARGDRLYAINPANGQVRWALPEGRRILASISVDDTPTAYVLGGGRSLMAVDEILGKVRAAIPLTGCDLFADNTSAPAIFVGGRQGQLYCLRPAGAARMTAESLIKLKAKARTTTAPAGLPASAPAGTGAPAGG